MEKSILMQLFFVFLLLALQGCQHLPTVSTPHSSSKKALPIIAAVDDQSNEKSPDNTSAEQAAGHDDNLWRRFQQQLQLAEMHTTEIQTTIHWYLKNKALLTNNQTRMGYFLYFIVDELEKEGVPVDIALIPIIESQYNPLASTRQTAGLWQFIPATANRFNLYSNSWYDGRLDPVESTKAVSVYFRYLLNYFNNDLLLAIAAYNAGEGTVQKAINSNRRAGKPTDFWSLNLPSGTKTYVHKLIALAHIYRHPEQYQLQLQAIKNEPYFTSRLIDNGLTMTQISDALQISTQEMYLLNAGIKPNQRPTRPKYSIHLPVNRLKNADIIISQLPRSHWVTQSRHQVIQGETLASISRVHGLQIEQLRDWNALKTDRLRIGQTLIIAKPVNTAAGNKTANPTTPKIRKIVHTVKSGDNLWDLAKKYRVKIAELMQWNHKNADSRLKIGEKLIILAPVKN